MYKDYAFTYYKEFIISRPKLTMFKKYNFNVNGCVSSHDWELFCAILFDANKTYGLCDLEQYEVKSAKRGGAFEYQYHRCSGLRKMDSDAKINHVFVIYDNEYQDVDVYILNYNVMKKIIANWKRHFKQNYLDGKQRFRKSIGYRFMLRHSTAIMRIRDGQLVV